MNQLKIQPAAKIDVEIATIWYEAQQEGLGVEFIFELDTALNRAIEAPESYQEIFPNVRRILVQRFPYSVYFIFERLTVEVIAILHQHMSPSAWQSRI